MNRYVYAIKKRYLKYILKKDDMELRIQQYRSKGVKIGNNMRAFSDLISAEPYLLEFGDNITVSVGVKFITHDNSVIKIIENATDTFGKIIIKDNCFIGMNAIILQGVTLGENTIVGAGSVVTKSFDSGNVVIAGNPAKVICTIDEYKNKIKSNVLNTKGLSYSEKKEYLLDNQDKFIER